MTGVKHEIQRYRIDDATETRPTQAIKDASGVWVLYSDHKERIAQLTAERTEIQHNSGPPSHDLRDVQIVSLQERIAQLTAERDHARKQVAVVQAALDSTDLARNKFLNERDAALREIEQWKTWGVIEIAIRNVNVSSYMDHWEGRATKAEAELSRLKAPVSDEEWGKGCHLANRSHVNNIIANRSKPQKEEQR